MGMRIGMGGLPYTFSNDLELQAMFSADLRGYCTAQNTACQGEVNDLARASCDQAWHAQGQSVVSPLTTDEQRAQWEAVYIPAFIHVFRHMRGLSKVVLPFGYAAENAKETLEALMHWTHAKTMLVDIRDWPHTSVEHFRFFDQDVLRVAYKGRYLWIQELGNVNHAKERRHLGIALRDRDAGIARLVEGLNKGYTLILVCACKSMEACHRRVVCEELAKEIEVEIVNVQ